MGGAEDGWVCKGQATVRRLSMHAQRCAVTALQRDSTTTWRGAVPSPSRVQEGRARLWPRWHS